MSLLQQLGVEAVVAGAASFKRDINQMQRSVDDAASTMTKSASSGAAMNAALGAVGVAAAAVAVAVAGVTAAVGGMLALMNRGAEISDIASAFKILEKSLGGTTNQLNKLQEGAAGTISDIELMRKTNMALMGTEGLLSQKFAAAIPKMLEVARVQANATGQSIESVFDAMTMGIKIAQTRTLKHAGILIDATVANEKYAASIGKTAADLTFEETQMATLNAVIEAGGKVLAKYGGISESADEKLNRIGATISNILDRLALAVQPAFKKILDSLQPIYDFLSRFATAAAPYVGAIAGMFADLVTGILGPIGKAAKKLNAAEVAKAFFTGGAKMIGSLAGGIAYAAKFVLDIVKTIAQGIANFLMGFSPPPEGPLHTIDVGGANVLKAWLEGFMGVSLDPVEQVASQVADMMGGIGTAARDQVETRLAALDAALQPFQDRLSLVKSEFEALKDPVDAAFSSIDRQLETALTALNQGKTGSAAMVRQLDNQREALQKYVDTQQAQVDTAQIQLSLAQAQQAQERTALEIRKRMLGPEAAAAATETPSTNFGTYNPSSTNLGEYKPATEEAKAVAAAIAPAMADVGNVLSDFDANMAEAKKDISTSFAAGFTGAGGDIAGLKQDVADINKAGGDISKSWNNLGPKLAGIARTIGDNLSAAWTIIKTNAETIWGQITKGISDVWDTLQIQLGETILNIRTNIETSWTSVQTWLTDTIGSIQTFVNDTWNNILDWIVARLGDIQKAVEDTWSGLQTWLTNTIGSIQKFVSDQWELMKTNVTTNVTNIYTNVMTTWNNIVNFISSIVGRVRSAFDDVSRAITGALQPAIDAINTISKFTNPNGATNPISPTGVANSIGLNASFSPLWNQSTWSQGLPTGIRGRADGGPASGLTMVGEGGPEFVTFSRQAYVISNQVSRLLASAASGIFASPASYAASGAGYGSNTVYNQQRSVGDINFNGIPGASDVTRRFAILRAAGRI